MSFCNFLLASLLHVGRFCKPVGLRGGLARQSVIHVLNNKKDKILKGNKILIIY